jgi:type II secretory pathway pseudopilin PulG
VEIALATAIIGIMALVALPSYVDIVETKRIEAEKASFANFEEDIKRSFQDSDWSRNIAAFAGTMPSAHASQFATAFGACSDSAHATDGAWFVKLGRLRGIAPDIGSPVTEDAQKSLFDLAYNTYNRPRLLIAGPTEPRQQRYLLISLLSPDSKGLVIPANDGSLAWFDAVWNNNWENKGATLPADWINRLTPDEQRAWMSGRGNTTGCHFLAVKRIVQPKFTITMNNTHPAYIGWVDIPGVALPLECGTNSVPVTSAEILGGTQVVFRRGTTPPGTEAYRINLNENTTFTVQP